MRVCLWLIPTCIDQKDGVNIMKGYMASGQFSRGKENICAEGSGQPIGWTKF